MIGGNKPCAFAEWSLLVGKYARAQGDPRPHPPVHPGSRAGKCCLEVHMCSRNTALPCPPVDSHGWHGDGEAGQDGGGAHLWMRVEDSGAC